MSHRIVRTCHRVGSTALLLVVAACGGGSSGSGGEAPPSVAELGTPTYIGGFPSYAASGYLDGDGHLDAVVADGATAQVRVLLGNGDGTFASVAPVGFGLSASLRQVALGYFDVDPYLDLAVLDDANKLHAFLGLGDGTFAPSPGGITDFAPSAVEDMTSGDFDEDGLDDIAVTTSVGVFVMLCNGNGSFAKTAASPITVGSSPSSIATGFMSNVHDDLLVGDGTDNTVTQLYGNGMGDFFLGTSAVVTAPNAIRIASSRTYVLTSALVGSRLHVLQFTGGQLQDMPGSPVTFPEHVGLDLQVVRSSVFERSLIATLFKNPDVTGLLVQVDLDAIGAPLDVTELGTSETPWLRGCSGDFVEGDPAEDAAFTLPYVGEIRVTTPR